MVFRIKTRKERKQEEFKRELEYHQNKLNRAKAQTPSSNYYGIDWTDSERKTAHSYAEEINKEQEIIDKMTKGKG
jgi:hypothetical protein